MKQHDNGQGDLFDPGEAHSRWSDPETSEQAAEEIRGTTASRLEAKVLAVLRNHPGGLTNHEICETTGLTWNTATPRVRPLCRKGLVFDSQERRKGPTNKTCVVWKAT